jgi:hypothetical protein
MMTGSSLTEQETKESEMNWDRLSYWCSGHWFETACDVLVRSTPRQIVHVVPNMSLRGEANASTNALATYSIMYSSCEVGGILG